MYLLTYTYVYTVYRYTLLRIFLSFTKKLLLHASTKVIWELKVNAMSACFQIKLGSFLTVYN